MKCLCLLLFFSGLTTVAAAQKNIRSGYAVTENGDTVTGTFNLKEWATNPDTIIIYPANREGAKRHFPTGHLISVILTDPPDMYEKWTVKLDMSMIDKNDYSVKYEDSSRTATVLLQKIYGGEKISLYYFSDIKDHFLVLHEGRMEALLLTYKTYTSRTYEYNKPGYSVFHRYRDQLQQYYNWQTDKRLNNKINRSSYSKEDLQEIISWIDKGHKQKDLLPNGAYLFAYAGFNFNTFNLHYINTLTNRYTITELKSGNVIMPGIGARFFSNRYTQRFFFDAGFRYYSASFSGEHIYHYISPARTEREVYTSEKKLFSLVNGVGYRLPVNSSIDVIGIFNGHFSYLINSSLKTDTYDASNGQFQRTETIRFGSHQTFQVSTAAGIGVKRSFEFYAGYILPYIVDKTQSKWSRISGVYLTAQYLRPFKKSK